MVRVVGEMLISECDLIDEGLGVSATSLWEGSHEGCGVYGNWEELLMRGRVSRVLGLIRAFVAKAIRKVRSGHICRWERLVPIGYDEKEHNDADGGADGYRL